MTNLEKAFHKMKADIQIKTGPRMETINRRNSRRTVRNRTPEGYTVNVRNGRFIFDLGTSGAKVTVQDADAADRHVLVNVQTEITITTRNGDSRKEIQNEKWLCGHDERDWFVSGATGITIWEAKQNLKPAQVQAVEGAVPKKKVQKRKNSARIRQGEWFFIPANDEVPTQNIIIHNDEPMSRPGGGKPHIVEEVVRFGGRVVWAKGTSVIEDKDFLNLETSKQRGYVRRQADANVYGRGYVKHPDHETILLEGWHKILMNTEKRNGKTLIFLD